MAIREYLREFGQNRRLAGLKSTKPRTEHEGLSLLKLCAIFLQENEI